MRAGRGWETSGKPEEQGPGRGRRDLEAVEEESRERLSGL